MNCTGYKPIILSLENKHWDQQSIEDLIQEILIEDFLRHEFDEIFF